MYWFLVLVVVVVTDSKAEHQKNDGPNQGQREEGQGCFFHVVLVHNESHNVSSPPLLKHQPSDQAGQ